MITKVHFVGPHAMHRRVIILSSGDRDRLAFPLTEIPSEFVFAHNTGSFFAQRKSLKERLESERISIKVHLNLTIRRNNTEQQRKGHKHFCVSTKKLLDLVN